MQAPPAVTGANFAEIVRQLDEQPASRSNRSIRDAVATFWAARGIERLGAGEYELAVGAIRGALVHYTPDELQAGNLPDALAPLARGLLEVSNPRGDEAQTLAANRVLTLLRTPDREAASRYEEVLRWGENNRREYRLPWVFHAEMADIYREISRVFPERTMLTRSREHSEQRRAEALRELARPLPDPRPEEQVMALRRAIERPVLDVTILHLRIGDLQGAAEHAETMTGSGSRGLAALLRSVVEDSTPEGYITMAQQLERVDGSAMAGICREGRRRFRDDPRFAQCLALAAETDSDYGLSAAHFEAAARLRPDDPEALGRAIAATARWLEAESSSDDSAVGRAAIARLRALSGEWSRRFAGRNPPLSSAEIDLAAAHFEVSVANITAAETLLDRAISAQSPPRGALLLRAEIAWRRGDGQRAADVLQRASELPLSAQESGSEVQPLITLRRAWALELAGQSAAATTAYQQAEAGYSALARSLEGARKASALMLHAQAADGLGRADAARESWDAALVAAPEDKDVAAAAVVFFMARGRWADAARVAASARGRLTLDRNWQTYFTLWSWAASKLAGSEDERARDGLRQLASHAGASSPWTVRLAQRATGAITFEQLSQHAQNAGHRAEAHFYEALSKLAANDREGAREALRATLRTDMMFFNEYQVAWTLERSLATPAR
jgi:tetratricopeptide (TPR) repeat protein